MERKVFDLSVERKAELFDEMFNVVSNVVSDAPAARVNFEAHIRMVTIVLPTFPRLSRFMNELLDEEEDYKRSREIYLLSGGVDDGKIS